MPTKTTKSGREYDIDGRTLIWHADVDEDEAPFDVRIPLRIKMRVLRAYNGAELSAENMMAMLEAIIPNQSEQLDEVDVNDFQEMFTTWQAEYELLNGASLGEASRSSA